MEPSPEKHSAFRFKLVLATMGITISIVLGEVGLRLLYQYRTSQQTAVYEAQEEGGRGDYDGAPLLRYNAFLGYSPIENHQGNGYTSNNYGFRYGENLEREKPNSEIRIFFTGGSTAWGSGVSQQFLYSNQLERDLQENFPDFRVRVVSAGIGGHLSTHERILVFNKLSELEPDIIVMFTGWNDTYAGYRGFRVLDGKWDNLEISSLIAKYDDRFGFHGTANDIINPPLFNDYTSKINYLFDRLIYNLRNRDEMAEIMEQNQIAPHLIVGDLAKNVTIVSDLAKQGNFSLVLYLQPTLYNTRKILTDFEKQMLDENQYIGFPNYNFQLYELYRSELPKIAQQENFLFFDGDHSIADETQTVFYDHVHFFKRGNTLVADHLKDILHKEILTIKENQQ